MIFITTAFFRGFVKEIFSLFNWLIALTLSYLLAPYLSKLLLFYSDNKFVADIAARVIIFIFVFIATALSTSGLCKALKEKMSKVFDRSLGVLFGIVKTLLIFGFIYSISLNLYGFLLGKNVEENSAPLPEWLLQAKCYNILHLSGNTLDPLVKKFFDATTKNLDKVVPKQDNLDEKINELLNKKDVAEPLDESSEDAGYNKKDIEKMNRLIEIIDK